MSKIEVLQDIKKKDNKDIIWEGFQTALELLKSKNEGVLDPVKEMAVKSAQKVVATAEEVMSDSSLTAMIAKLRTNGTVTLEEIAAKIAEAKEGYEALVQAKDIKATELNDMFGIEKELLDLAVVVNTNESLKAKYSEELDAIKEESTELICTKRTEASEILSLAKEEAKEIKEQAELAKKKEQAEWNYTFGRQKVRDRDDFADELAYERKEFLEKAESTKKEIAIKDKEVTEREAAVSNKEEEFTKLRTAVDEIPHITAVAVDRAVKKAIEAETEKSSTLADFKEKEYQSEKKSLDREIEMLKADNDKKDNQIADLTKKLDDAYLQIKAVASDVANASRPVISAQSNNSSK